MSEQTTNHGKVFDQVVTDDYSIYHADTVEVARMLPDNSVGFSIFSPPFESLFTYSNSLHDMGNSASSEEFWEQYRFLINEQFRVMQEGRCIAIHCMNMPTSKFHHGYIGVRDFRGEIIRAYQEAGFIYHSEVCIWKDPVVAMQRTKAVGLLHKTIKTDSSKSRQGLADYIVVMRKRGDNENKIEGEFTHYAGEEKIQGFREVQYNDGRVVQVPVEDKGTSIDVWQRYASPVWSDINQTNTLNYKLARDKSDERHICPLQLDVIERCLQLWSKEGDIVWSPFMGVGSEGYVSLKMGRKFVGAELKESYFKCAAKHLDEAVNVGQYDLF